jgi:hypothetical protein
MNGRRVSFLAHVREDLGFVHRRIAFQDVDFRINGGDGQLAARFCGLRPSPLLSLEAVPQTLEAGRPPREGWGHGFEGKLVLFLNSAVRIISLPGED